MRKPLNDKFERGDRWFLLFVFAVIVITAIIITLEITISQAQPVIHKPAPKDSLIVVPAPQVMPAKSALLQEPPKEVIVFEPYTFTAE